jgi:hypothetical protein
MREARGQRAAHRFMVAQQRRRVVAFCGGVQAIAMRLGEARALGGFPPLAFLLVGAKATPGRAEVRMRAREQ